MSTYPTYKPSGIEWLGDIPEHWPTERLHNKCDIVRGNSSFKKDELLSKGKYVALQYGKTYKVEEIDQRFKFYVNDEFYKSEQVVNYKDVIFISTSETLEDLGHSVFYNRKDIGLVGGEQILLKPDRKILDGKYLFYYSKIFGKELNKFATGVKVFRFDVNDLKTIYLPLPLLSEQTAIANYLDEKTSKLDQLINNKKTQIEKLKEIRQIEINTAVTKGLDPDVTLKPSGIEWLGDIPEHWEVKRLKNVTKLKQGLQIAQELRFFKKVENSLEYITIKYLNNKKDSLVEYIQSADEGVICYEDDILLARTGATGQVITGVKGVFHNNFFKVKYDKLRIGRDYLVYYLSNSSIYDYLLLLAGTTTIPDLNHGSFYSCPLILPDKSTQANIVNYLDEKTSKLDQLVSNLENQIEQLEEVRKIEIYNAVTGKIKVA